MRKKIVSLLAVAALTALGTTVVLAGQVPRTGVNGSMHDITYLGKSGGYYAQDDFQRVCIFCHTPHNAQAQGDVPAPLWNHEPATVDMAPYAWAAPANPPIASPGRAITDLTVTHPIGFLYSDAYAERGPTELIPDSAFFVDRIPST